MKTKIQLALAVVAVLFLTVVLGATKYDARNIVVVEDHPWVIKNETCLNVTGNRSCLSPCYRGLLINMLHRIQPELKCFSNCKIHEVDSFGTLQKGVWSGLMGDLVKNVCRVQAETKNISFPEILPPCQFQKSDMALAVLNITPERKKAITFSSPVIHNTSKNITLALGFPKGSKLEAPMNDVIKKLVNQRHIEQLLEVWFNEQYEDSWSEKKQHTKYINKKINKRKQ